MASSFRVLLSKIFSEMEHDDGHTLAELARELKITPSALSQIKHDSKRGNSIAKSVRLLTWFTQNGYLTVDPNTFHLSEGPIFQHTPNDVHEPPAQYTAVLTHSNTQWLTRQLHATAAHLKDKTIPDPEKEKALYDLYQLLEDHFKKEPH